MSASQGPGRLADSTSRRQLAFERKCLLDAPVFRVYHKGMGMN